MKMQSLQLSIAVQLYMKSEKKISPSRLEDPRQKITANTTTQEPEKIVNVSQSPQSEFTQSCFDVTSIFFFLHAVVK